MQTKKVTTDLSKIDRAVATVEFIMKKRRRQVSEMEKRVGINENQRIFMGDELEWMKNVQLLIDRCKSNINMSLGKLPPQATELEVTVLGAILLVNSDETKKVLTFLKPEHFYDERHRIIYEACMAMNFKGKLIDMTAISNELRRTGKGELVGGAGYIAELTMKVTSTANVEHHARILIEQAIKRQLIIMGGTVLSDGYDDKDCFEILEFAEEQIKGVKEWIK